MKVLFVCKYNAGRSRMAEAFFNLMSRKNTAFSRGVSPYPSLPSNATGIRATARVMGELGIRVRPGLGKGVSSADVAEAGMVVVLLDGKQARVLPKFVSSSRKTRFCPIPDSDARSRDFLDQQRCNRDAVRGVVQELVDELG